MKHYHPNFDEFLKLCERGNTIPVYRQLLSDALTPVTAIKSGTARLKKLAGDAPDIIWGASLEGGLRDYLEKTAKLGADFVVFPAAGTPASVPPENDAGVVLEIETSISDTLLRTVNDAPVDAVLVKDEERGEGPLTWAEMLRLHRVVKLLSLPLAPNE